MRGALSCAALAASGVSVAWGHSHDRGAFSRNLLWVILPISVVAVGLAWGPHHDAGVFALVGVGLVLLIIAALWAHDRAPAWVDQTLSLAGSAVLAAGHIRNSLLCRGKA